MSNQLNPKIFWFYWHFLKSYLVVKLAKKQDVCESTHSQENGKLIMKSSSPANNSNTNSSKQTYAREATENSLYEISLPTGL